MGDGDQSNTVSADYISSVSPQVRYLRLVIGPPIEYIVMIDWRAVPGKRSMLPVHPLPCSRSFLFHFHSDGPYNLTLNSTVMVHRHAIMELSSLDILSAMRELCHSFLRRLLGSTTNLPRYTCSPGSNSARDGVES